MSFNTAQAGVLQVSYDSVTSLKPDLMSDTMFSVLSYVIIVVGAILLCLVIYIRVKTWVPNASRRDRKYMINITTFWIALVIGLGVAAMNYLTISYQRDYIKYEEWVHNYYIPYVDSASYADEWIVTEFVEVDGDVFAKYGNDNYYAFIQQSNPEMTIYNSRFVIKLNSPDSYVIRAKRVGNNLIPFLYENK